MNVMVLDRSPISEQTMSKPQELQSLIMVVTDHVARFRPLEVVCDFFDIGVEFVSSSLDVKFLMQEFRPMALVTEAELSGQDGFHVMRQVAEHNRTLPVMIVTGADPALLGAADAIQDISGLTDVRAAMTLPSMAEMVDFLFRAGRQAGIGRMMPLGVR